MWESMEKLIRYLVVGTHVVSNSCSHYKCEVATGGPYVVQDPKAWWTRGPLPIRH
jgi:hypothetical protein